MVPTSNVPMVAAGGGGNFPYYSLERAIFLNEQIESTLEDCSLLNSGC